eukprot:TRINITY_DN12036_c0_g1_i2.p1 TRINITY_DN12036_c0_g1~~TRINITY_DN12036_c0_g1_i2.p1  ORF type:complete len:399 (+),score=200.74 TRINITY_DN12036_c0_g1_i2:25-1197(+)
MSDEEAEVKEGEDPQELQLQNDAAAIIQKYWRDSTRRGMDAMGDEEDDVPVVTEQEKKEALIEEFKEELKRRERLLDENIKMQRALCKHFDQKKQTEQDKSSEIHNAAEAENKYLSLLDQVRQSRIEVEGLKSQNLEDLDTAKEKMNSHQTKADEYELSFRNFKREKAMLATFSRNKKPLPKKKLEAIETQEEKRNLEVKLARIGYIRMRNRAKKLSDLLKEKEKLTDGLHLIDFEQLKIENTTLNEKIEERNEDLLKLKKKATTTIHILTHVKEKLQYIQGENQGLRKQLDSLDDDLDVHRAKMSSVKRDRDVFVSENVKMREKMPMIGSEDLLMDYEIRKQQIETLRIEVVEKTNRHHELMQWINKWQPTVHQRQATLQKSALNKIHA